MQTQVMGFASSHHFTILSQILILLERALEKMRLNGMDIEFESTLYLYA